MISDKATMYKSAVPSGYLSNELVVMRTLCVSVCPVIAEEQRLVY